MQPVIRAVGMGDYSMKIFLQGANTLQRSMGCRRGGVADPHFYDALHGTEEKRTPVGRSDFKSGEGRQTSLVGSTPTLFRQSTAAQPRKAGSGFGCHLRPPAPHGHQDRRPRLSAFRRMRAENSLSTVPRNNAGKHRSAQGHSGARNRASFSAREPREDGSAS